MLRRFFLGLVVVLGSVLSAAQAGDSFEDSRFIRDAEIEATLKAYMAPLFEAAGMSPENIGINLVVDKRLNAMATIGYQFILFTGFLLRADNVGQVIGVLAHETGHVADGHVARIFGEMKKMTVVSVAHALLGVAAAIAGSPEAGIAIGMGGMGMAQGNFLHYHRGQEAAADHNAMRYLDKLGWSSKGLGEFLDILRKQEYFSSSRQDPYLRTHPLTQNRVQAVRGHVEASKYANVPYSKDFETKFQMMQAKLRAYLYPAEALGKYPETDQSQHGKYARAIAHYRQQDLDRAFRLIAELVAEQPKNPYFWELKGQVLFENGRTREALIPYEKAVKLAPKSGLLKVQYAQVLIASNDSAHFKKAEALLKQAHMSEKENPLLWRLLAIVYGKRKQEGLMSLALAEEAYLRGNEKATIYQANRAMRKLPKNSSPWIRAQDLLADVKQAQA